MQDSLIACNYWGGMKENRIRTGAAASADGVALLASAGAGESCALPSSDAAGACRRWWESGCQR